MQDLGLVAQSETLCYIAMPLCNAKSRSTSVSLLTSSASPALDLSPSFRDIVYASRLRSRFTEAFLPLFTEEGNVLLPLALNLAKSDSLYSLLVSLELDE